MSRHRPPTREQQLDALLACPLLYDIAADLVPLVRRRRRHPIALHLAWGAMARLYTSANRLDAAVTNGDWPRVIDRYNTVARARPEIPRVGRYLPPITSDTYRHARAWLTRHDVLDALLEAFTAHSVPLAQDLGLLDPDGPGSRTRPHPSRTVTGDGTILRPLYRPSAGRTDPDAGLHVRHDGRQYGNSLVTVSVRERQAHRRVILAVGRVHAPGREAATATELIRSVHNHAGDGIQAVVYDGAFRGTHHEQLMSDLGLIVVNKVHPATVDEDGEPIDYRTVPLGRWTHTIDGRDCSHTLVAHNGAVHDASFDDAGTPVLSDPLERKQVRRYPRGRTGGYRFSLGVTVPCPRAPFAAWISPHPQAGETSHRRPDQLRLIPPSDDHFQTLYGLRNDSEAINAEYKRTLPWTRAAALGWRRQLLDLLSWALLNNSLAWSRHGRASEPYRIHR
jgi:hypothetical protein